MYFYEHTLIIQTNESGYNIWVKKTSN
jgi:hypothetical protein